MDEGKSRQQWFLRRRNRLFWIVFAIAGAVIALRLPIAEILLGVTIILLGVYKLGSELEHRKLIAELDNARAAVARLNEGDALLAKRLQSIQVKVDTRFFAMDRKRIQSEKKILQSYRQATKGTAQLKKSMEAVARAVSAVARKRARVKIEV